MNNLIKKIKVQKGFTLIEITVVAGIVALVGGTAIYSYSEQRDLAKWKETAIKLDVIKQTTLKYAEINKYLPCPDSLTAQDGREDRVSRTGSSQDIDIDATNLIAATDTDPVIPGNAAESFSAENNISVNTCLTENGTVPYETLGLTIEDTRDSWGQDITYAVVRGVDSAAAMLDCPNNSACFFNSDELPVELLGRGHPSLPAYNLTTVQNAFNANTLNICSDPTDPACSNPVLEGLVAVFLATGKNSGQLTGLSDSENENLDGDRTFITQEYSKTPYFDDLISSISANEVKLNYAPEIIETVSSGDGTQQAVLNDVNNLGSNKVGTSGSNNSNDNSSNFMDSRVLRAGNDDNSVNQLDALFKGVEDDAWLEITFKTYAVGTWDFKGENSTSNDKFYVDVNGENLVTKNYDSSKNDHDGYITGYLDKKNPNKDSDDVYYSLKDSQVTGKVSDYQGQDEDGNLVEGYVAKENVKGSPDSHLKYWEEEHEITSQMVNGELELDLKVGTTGTDETVNFSEITMTYYDLPSNKPSFPKVDKSGLPQVGGLD